MALLEEQPWTKNLLVLGDRTRILALAPLLQELAQRCRQAAAFHWLPYFLDPGVLGRRSPRLVLFLVREIATGEAFRVDDLCAAALYFEYEFCGVRTGVVATGDAVGFNTVIAPRSARKHVAALASEALLTQGAHTLVTTYEAGDDGPAPEAAPDASGTRSALRKRKVRRMLPLRSTVDATLAQMGKTTRWNFRYYRRRLEKQIPCEFVPDAAPLLDRASMLALNAASLNPVEAEECLRRAHAATALPGSFLCGLRTSTGQWLSLIGGWRQDATTVLYWQMNSAGFEKHSLGTVMRSFFIEAEIARSTKTLLIYGGTPHSMRHAFTQDTVVDLLVQRRGVRSRLTQQVARFLLRSNLLGRGNFVAEALCDPSLQWNAWPRGSPAVQAGPAQLKPTRAQHVA